MQLADVRTSVQVVRQHLPSGSAAVRFNIDATLRGNMARFVNHRCGDPSAVLVIVWRSGEYLPVVALVSRRALSVGDEITWSYGDPSQDEQQQFGASSSPNRGVDGQVAVAGPHSDNPAAQASRREVCLCGSDVCTGFMPLR